MAQTGKNDYFKRTSLFWIIAVTLAVGHFTVIVFAPELFPFAYLGPYGTFCQYLQENHSNALYNVWLLALAIHVAEALISQVLCSNKGITSPTARFLWFFQSFLFGICSLGLLIKYDPKRPKQN
ncbi:transmembrane protein 254-like [Neosynchiropus ocellatus]